MDCFKCELGVWPLYKSGMEFMDGISFGLLHLTCICLQCLIRIDGDPISSKHILQNILRTLYIYKHRDKPYKNTTCLFVTVGLVCRFFLSEEEFHLAVGSQTVALEDGRCSKSDSHDRGGCRAIAFERCP